MQANRSQDLAQTTFQLLALSALIATSFQIVWPFLEALAWTTMIVVSTWPLLLRAQAWLGARRSLAVALMTITLQLILVVSL
jgi:predicted PurR-regulated permease PerM